GLLYDPAALRFYGRTQRAARPGAMPGRRPPLQPDGNLIHYRPREGAAAPARHRILALARPAFQPDDKQHARRHRILPHSAQPCGRARRPDRDLNEYRPVTVRRILWFLYITVGDPASNSYINCSKY